MCANSIEFLSTWTFLHLQSIHYYAIKCVIFLPANTLPSLEYFYRYFLCQWALTPWYAIFWLSLSFPGNFWMLPENWIRELHLVRFLRKIFSLVFKNFPNFFQICKQFFEIPEIYLKIYQNFIKIWSIFWKFSKISTHFFGEFASRIPFSRKYNSAYVTTHVHYFSGGRRKFPAPKFWLRYTVVQRNGNIAPGYYFSKIDTMS